MARFLIQYRDPETGETAQTEAAFEDTDMVSATEWAKDYAYALADKGPYKIKRLDDA